MLGDSPTTGFPASKNDSAKELWPDMSVSARQVAEPWATIAVYGFEGTSSETYTQPRRLSIDTVGRSSGEIRSVEHPGSDATQSVG